MKKGIIFLFSTIFIFDLIKEQHLCHGKSGGFITAGL